MSKKNENIVVLVVALALIAAIAAGILAWVDHITKKPREEAELRETNQALKKLQPELTNNPDKEKIYIVRKNKDWTLLPKDKVKEDISKINVVDQIIFFPAKKDGKLLSVIGQGVSPKGYGGNMTVLVAMDSKGVVQNVLVTKNNETPGLGTVVIDRVREKTIFTVLSDKKVDNTKLPPNKILDQFDGKSYVPKADMVKEAGQIPADKWKVKKDGGDMLYITGATISSRAVTYGVEKVLTVYFQTQKDVLKAFEEE